MGFSEKMRDSLGAEGAKIEVAAGDAAVAPGATTKVAIAIVGGSKPAVVDAVVIRLIEADRHWQDGSGARISEADAAAREHRDGLVAGWTRNTLLERRVDVGVTVQAGSRHELVVDVDVPAACKPSGPACNHTMHVQADIKGQIDPTGQGRITVG